MAPRTETTKLEDLWGTLLFSSESLGELIKRLKQHHFEFSGIDVDRGDGRHAQDLTLEAAEALDNGWWRSCSQISIDFKLQRVQGVADITLTLPPQRVLQDKISIYLRSVLSGREEVRDFLLSHSAGYPTFLTSKPFWLLVSLCPNLRFLPFLRGHQAVTYVLYVLCCVSLYMYFDGSRRVFPRVRFALGTAEAPSERKSKRTNQLLGAIWEICKLILAAVFGAMAQAWLGKHK